MVSRAASLPRVDISVRALLLLLPVPMITMIRMAWATSRTARTQVDTDSSRRRLSGMIKPMVWLVLLVWPEPAWLVQRWDRADGLPESTTVAMANSPWAKGQWTEDIKTPRTTTTLTGGASLAALRTKVTAWVLDAGHRLAALMALTVPMALSVQI